MRWKGRPVHKKKSKQEVPNRSLDGVDVCVSSVKDTIVQIHIEKLPEGVCLATSEDMQGLVAQGKTIVETIEIARDLARRLLEVQEDIKLPQVDESFDHPLIV